MPYQRLRLYNGPILVAFYDTHGDTEDTFSTWAPGPTGGIN